MQGPQYLLGTGQSALPRTWDLRLRPRPLWGLHRLAHQLRRARRAHRS